MDDEVSWWLVITDGVVGVTDAEAAGTCWAWVPRGFEGVPVENGTCRGFTVTRGGRRRRRGGSGLGKSEWVVYTLRWVVEGEVE